MAENKKEDTSQKVTYIAQANLFDTVKKVKISEGEEVKGFSKERIEKLLDKKLIKKA